MRYTDEERERWENWFHENGEELLKMPVAGDRDSTIGALILHIFGPELRYVERLRDQPVTEYRGRPSDNLAQVFGFGMETRKVLRGYVRDAAPRDWERLVSFDLGGRHYRASVRKIVFHVLLHEIRHWAQVARLMRERGFVPPGDHDLITSTALG